MDTYRTKTVAIFVPTTIASQPAVLQKSYEGAPACTITTGIAQGQALETTWYELRLRNGRPVVDPCVPARRAVEAVVGNLPPLS